MDMVVWPTNCLDLEDFTPVSQVVERSVEGFQ
jgi:hypothetical protein